MSFRCPPYSSVSPSSTSEPNQARPSLPSPRRFTPLRVLPPPKPSRSHWSVVTPVSPPYPPISTQITREEWNAFDRRRKDPESERLQRQALVKAHSESQHAYPISSLKRRLGHNASEQKRRESISYERLKMLVPGCDVVETTKAQLVSRSAKYILHLEYQLQRQRSQSAA